MIQEFFLCVEGIRGCDLFLWCRFFLHFNKVIVFYWSRVDYASHFKNVDWLFFCIKFLFSVKVRFSAEASSLLPKISFVSEENATATITKPTKTSEQNADSGTSLEETEQNTDGKGKSAQPDPCVLSLLVSG